MAGLAEFPPRARRYYILIYLAYLFAKPKMRPLKFNKCPSNLKRESERTCERSQLTSNLYYVRDATDPPGKRGGEWCEGGATAGHDGVGRRREGGETRAGRSGGGEVVVGGTRERAGGFGSPRPHSGPSGNSGFSRGRLSGVSVRRPAAQQACALSRFFVPFLAYQKHESDRRRIYPWCSTARRYNAVRIFVREDPRAAVALARVPPRHTAQPSGK